MDQVIQSLAGTNVLVVGALPSLAASLMVGFVVVVLLETALG